MLPPPSPGRTTALELSEPDCRKRSAFSIDSHFSATLLLGREGKSAQFEIENWARVARSQAACRLALRHAHASDVRGEILNKPLGAAVRRVEVSAPWHR